jgi:hypothetical protein
MRIFHMAWQLETWLRLFAYVELRAARPDWEQPIKSHVNNWPPNSQPKDKRLHHMATPHQAAVSYLTFGELWAVISDPNLWPIFEPYFPPEKNTFVRIEEVKTIRNRVAHFREPHAQDEARLELFLHDMESGIRRFCSRYMAGKAGEADPVATHLEQVWPTIGYGIELHRPDNGWLYAPPPHRMQPRLHARLELLTHMIYQPNSLEGVIYCLVIQPAFDKKINIKDFYVATKSLHKDIIHIMLPADGDAICVTIPAIHGIKETAEIIAAFLSAGLNCALSSFVPSVEELRTEWPEYILWPDHILMRGTTLDFKGGIAVANQ